MALRSYIVNDTDNTVSVINNETNTVIATIPVGSGPVGVAVLPNGRFVYITNESGNTVSVINTATNTVIATINVGTFPAGVAALPNSQKVYVSNLTSNDVSVIDVATNTVITTIPVGNFPGGIASSPNGAFIYVSNASDGSVSVIDTTTDTVVHTIAVGGNTQEIAFTPNGAYAYVANNSGYVSVIDTTTYNVVFTRNTGGNPLMIVFNPNGLFAYVTVPNLNETVILDTSNPAAPTINGVITHGTTPTGIDITPDGQLLYITHGTSQNTVTVVRTSDSVLVTTITVGNVPISLGRFIGSVASSNRGGGGVNPAMLLPNIIKVKMNDCVAQIPYRGLIYKFIGKDMQGYCVYKKTYETTRYSWVKF